MNSEAETCEAECECADAECECGDECCEGECECEAECEQVEDAGNIDKKDPKDIAIEELQDKVKRQMAEFDNFRKRTEKEKSMMFEMGAADVIKKLLPIVDNFERGFKSVSAEELETPFAKGMDMVYKQITKMFEDLDVKPIEAAGQEFNPDLHNAVMHVDDDSFGDNIVVEEFEKGYTYRGTVVRHSMVKVAN
ncbi:MAG: nucleotide exchange factor GrpE [Lachnospira sp.]|nr:nucleotide exchange factor GrpE [Lachnospira sp.]